MIFTWETSNTSHVGKHKISLEVLINNNQIIYYSFNLTVYGINSGPPFFKTTLENIVIYTDKVFKLLFPDIKDPDNDKISKPIIIGLNIPFVFG